MIATVSFVQNAFERFNALCFEGTLPAVPIVLTKARTFLGKMEYCQKRSLFGRVVSNSDFRLKISTSFDLSQEELEDVVIHEMIHYYIAFRGIKDTSVHGQVFRQMMNNINRNFGRHIELRHHSVTAVPGGRGVVPKKHYLCVSTFPDGTQGITVCASTRIHEISRLLPKRYRIVSLDWYGSLDPFFDRYPRSNTPKIYRITKAELSEHLIDSVPLEAI